MIVELKKLVKVFEGKPPVTAVNGIDLEVPDGGIFGLLGPNGAGKTTTISMCTTRVLPTSGSVRIAGVDVVRSPALARRYIGVVTQYNTLDRACTVFENLYFHCRYFGQSRADSRARANALLGQFLLSDKADSFPWQISGGLAQRLQIARAIAHHPAVLFLDEPSAGLDPQSRIAMWDAVRALRVEGITVVLTTHYMEEADEICDRLAIIDHGKILIEDTPAALKASVGGDIISDLRMHGVRDSGLLEKELATIDGVTRVEVIEGGLRVLARVVDGLLAKVVTTANGYGLRDVTTTEPSLETVFIRLTGRDLRE